MAKSGSNPGWPSKTGKPSGGGRVNNLPKGKPITKVVVPKISPRRAPKG